MRDKALVDADIYIEDTPSHIESLQTCEKEVIAFTNSTNRNMTPSPFRRADNWNQAEEIVRDRYYTWRQRTGLPLPSAAGHQPPDAEEVADNFTSPRAG
jgi:hypothetical protein